MRKRESEKEETKNNETRELWLDVGSSSTEQDAEDKGIDGDDEEKNGPNRNENANEENIY